MKTITISMNYIGKVLSVNHYQGRRRDGGTYVKSETRDWMTEFGWKLKPYHIEDWKQPITVRCDGVFKDLRSTPDLSNCLKIICDEVEEITGINDRYYKTETGTPVINKRREPMLFITISEAQ